MVYCNRYVVLISVSFEVSIKISKNEAGQKEMVML